MAGKKLTTENWNQIIPNLRGKSKGYRTSEIEKTASVITAVFLHVRWEGIFPEQNLEIDSFEEILYRAGRWRVREGGIDCDETAYTIERVRLNDEDWVAQLTEKSWLYDPSDMLDAFEYAYERFFPKSAPNERTAKMDRLIHNALERLQFPFLPSSQMRRSVYLPSRMNEAQRKAFCKFLAENGYHPSF